MGGFWMGFAQGAMDKVSGDIANNNKQRDDFVRTAYRDFLENGLPRIQKEREQYDNVVRVGNLVKARYGEQAASYVMEAKIGDYGKAMELINTSLDTTKLTPGAPPQGGTPAPTSVPTLTAQGGQSQGGFPDLTGVVGAGSAPPAPLAQPQPQATPAPSQAPAQPPAQKTGGGFLGGVKDAWDILTGKPDMGDVRKRALDAVSSVPHAKPEDVAMLRDGRSPLDALPKGKTDFATLPFKSMDQAGMELSKFVLENASRFNNAPELIAAATEGMKTGRYDKLYALPKDMLTRGQEIDKQTSATLAAAKMRQTPNTLGEIAASIIAIPASKRTPDQVQQLEEVMKVSKGMRASNGSSIFDDDTPAPGAAKPPPPQAITDLKNANTPERRKAFDGIFGPGAAAKYVPVS